LARKKNGCGRPGFVSIHFPQTFVEKNRPGITAFEEFCSDASGGPARVKERPKVIVLLHRNLLTPFRERLGLSSPRRKNA